MRKTPKQAARGIVLRRGKYWFNFQKNGKREWINLHTSDYPEALRAVDAIRASPVLASVTLLRDEVARFVAYKLAMDEFTKNSAEKAKGILGTFAKAHPGATLASVSPSAVQAWYAALRKRVTESTAQSYVMTLRSLFQWAVEVERARVDNPVAKVALAQLPRRSRKRFATKAERDTLIEKAPDDDLRFILFCGFHAGMRRNEITEARVRWFDTEASLVHVEKTETFRPKDREDRTIPMTKAFRVFLAEYLKGKKSDAFALRNDVEQGKWRYRYDYRKPFENYVRAAGMEWVTPHLMRRSFASILASQSVSIYKIAKWLGDDVRVTQDHYAHLIPSDSDIEQLQ